MSLFDDILNDLVSTVSDRVSKRVREFGSDLSQMAEATADAIEGVDGVSPIAEAARAACKHRAVVVTTDERRVCIVCGAEVPA